MRLYTRRHIELTVLLALHVLFAGCEEKLPLEDPNYAGEASYRERQLNDQRQTRPEDGERPKASPRHTPDSPFAGAEAVDFNMLRKRDGRFFHNGETEPYTGWVKTGFGDSGMIESRFQNGRKEGLEIWYRGNRDKMGEVIYRDGQPISNTFWNRKGEEVQRIDEAIR